MLVAGRTGDSFSLRECRWWGFFPFRHLALVTRCVSACCVGLRSWCSQLIRTIDMFSILLVLEVINLWDAWSSTSICVSGAPWASFIIWFFDCFFFLREVSLYLQKRRCTVNGWRGSAAVLDYMYMCFLLLVENTSSLKCSLAQHCNNLVFGATVWGSDR